MITYNAATLGERSQAPFPQRGNSNLLFITSSDSELLLDFSPELYATLKPGGLFNRTILLNFL